MAERGYGKSRSLKAVSGCLAWSAHAAPTCALSAQRRAWLIPSSISAATSALAAHLLTSASSHTGHGTTFGPCVSRTGKEASAQSVPAARSDRERLDGSICLPAPAAAAARWHGRGGSLGDAIEVVSHSRGGRSSWIRPSSQCRTPASICCSAGSSIGEAARPAETLEMALQKIAQQNAAAPSEADIVSKSLDAGE